MKSGNRALGGQAAQCPPGQFIGENNQCIDPNDNQVMIPYCAAWGMGTPECHLWGTPKWEGSPGFNPYTQKRGGKLRRGRKPVISRKFGPGGVPGHPHPHADNDCYCYQTGVGVFPSGNNCVNTMGQVLGNLCTPHPPPGAIARRKNMPPSPRGGGSPGGPGGPANCGTGPPCPAGLTCINGKCLAMKTAGSTYARGGRTKSMMHRGGLPHSHPGGNIRINKQQAPMDPHPPGQCNPECSPAEECHCDPVCRCTRVSHRGALNASGGRISGNKSYRAGGNTGCTMHTGKYDCESNGCSWDFNNSCCH